MNKWRIIIAILLAALSILAIGIALNAVVFGGRVDLALVAAVILLSLAQLISLFNRSGSKHKAEVDINDLMMANEHLTQEASLLRRRLERVERKVYSEQAATTEQLDAQVQALEHSVSALTKQRYSDEMETNLRDEPALRSAPMPRHLDLYLLLSDSRTTGCR